MQPQAKKQPICITDKYGLKHWLLSGIVHREDGPAIEFAIGHTEWWLDDQCYYDISNYCDALRITDEEKTFFLAKWAK